MTSTGSPYSYRGKHYPINRRWWGGHFPEPHTGLVAFGPPGPHATVPGDGPGGVAILAIGLGLGATVTYSWATDVFKARSGKERRACLLDSPKETYKGTAHLVGDDVRTMRGVLARYAASGSPFLLAQSHEALSVARAGTTEAVYVGAGALAYCDWANPGQRVVVTAQQVTGRPLAIAAVVQSATSDTIYLDVPLGALGVVGATIAPTVSVYLEPQQSFGRHIPAEPVEEWQISARSLQFGRKSVALAAILPLNTPTSGTVLDGLVVVARTPGTAGNLITVQFQAATLGVGVNCVLTESIPTSTMLVKFRTGVCTVQQIVNLFATSVLASIEGTYTATDVLSSGSEEFVPLPLTGGADATVIPPGKGATLTAYDGRPVWDRGLVVQDTASDGLQSLTELIDLGGIPLSASDTQISDWARQVHAVGSGRADRQWLKLMLATVAGRWKSFWLPSWRKDLIPTAVASGTAGVKAALPLAPPVANSGAMDLLTIQAKTAGAAGNTISVQFVGNALATSGEYEETGTTIVVRFVPTVTTDAQIKTLINAAGVLVQMNGTTSGLALQAGDDELGPVNLYGGVDAVGSTLTLPQGPANGDFGAWALQRDRLQIQQTDGTITYAKILSIFTAGSTYTLSLDAGLSASPIATVSWLELVRFESDDVPVTVDASGLAVNQQARVVQR